MSNFLVAINPFMHEIDTGAGNVSDVQAGGSLADLDVKTVTQTTAADYEAERLAELERKQAEAEAAARAAAIEAAKERARLAATAATAAGAANVAAGQTASKRDDWIVWALIAGAGVIAWKVWG